MSAERKIQVWSAMAMLLAGVALSIAGFIAPPYGEISDSVLWFFAQTLLYAGGVFGISSFVQIKLDKFKKDFIKDQTPKP